MIKHRRKNKLNVREIRTNKSKNNLVINDGHRRSSVDVIGIVAPFPAVDLFLHYDFPQLLILVVQLIQLGLKVLVLLE